MRGSDDASGQKKVVDIPAVHATIRDLIAPLAVPLVTPGLLKENPLRRMQVDRPATERQGIVMIPLLDDILLYQDIIALNSPTLPFTGVMSHPFQGKVFRFRKLNGILDMPPHTIHDFPKFTFYLL